MNSYDFKKPKIVQNKVCDFILKTFIYTLYYHLFLQKSVIIGSL